MKRIIFMGTPDFAVPVLEQLANKYEVVAVVTQPDRPVGRKRVLTPPPVKKKAEELGLPVFQPEKLRQSEALETLIDLQADLLVTAAYGQILPKRLLEAEKYGAINVHASLLPAYRGGAPIHYAVMNGEKETGVTIMYMVEQLDAGDMIAQRKIPITDQDDTGVIFQKLSEVGATLLMETLPAFFAGEFTAIPQQESEVSYARNITREQEKIDWRRPARDVFNQIRGLSPFPTAYTTLEGKPFKISKAHLSEQTSKLKPGSFLLLTKSAFGIVCGDGGVIAPDVIQPAGKPKMETAAFMQGAGRQMSEETRFGE
ncbi:methionyl-tRNA formyltransferase [Listeria aquatica]|uniref:methionyl-tRNA formyltransferase n=1 Tax=Listeria aquatica TaxID=1494960 RepID=UPI003EF78B3F